MKQVLPSKWNLKDYKKTFDRDENAAKNIRAEGIRILSVLGTRTVEAWKGCKTKSSFSRSLHPRERRPLYCKV